MFRCICVLVIYLYFWKNYCENVHANDVVQRFNNMTKAPQDKRQYRALTLKNGLKVVLISDPHTEKSAASLIVGIGTINDPGERPGLVHLVGHALMRAGQNQFRKFKTIVETHGGRIEAPLTGEEIQCFGFEVDTTFFAEAFNRFAQFFIEPRISYDPKPKTLMDPLEALETEHREHKAQDVYRLAQVEKEIGKPSHPYNHLALGSMYTLCPQAKISRTGAFVLPQHVVKLIYDEVRNFYPIWYSANIMTLAVLGKETLDQLERMVTSLFQKLRCNDPPVKKMEFSYDDHPWGTEQLRNKIYVVPLDEDIQYLALSFPIRDYHLLPDSYNAAADDYVHYCITHEDRGALSSVLRNRDLCDSVDFQYNTIAGVGMARIVCDITEEGLRQIDTVINLVFQYIHLLNEDGPREWMFHEISVSSEKSFLYMDTAPDDPLEYARSVAGHLQLDNFPIENALSRAYFRNQWQPEVIREFLSHFRPENMNAIIVSKSYVNMARLSSEKYFGTRYKIEKIPKQFIQKWSAKESETDLKLPLPTEFITENLYMYPLDKKNSEAPYIIHESPTLEIWFKQDDVIRLPELYINFELISPITRIGPVENTLWRLFHNHLINSLSKNLYSPQISGINWADWSIEITEPGLLFKLTGLGDKLPLLLEKILSKLTNSEKELDGDNFDSLIKGFIRNVKHEVSKNHVFQSEWYLQHLYVDGVYDVEVLVNSANLLQLSDMKKFLRRMFQRIFVRGLIFGNCNEKKALEIVEMFEKPFYSSKGLLLRQILRPRFMELVDGLHYIYQVPNRNRAVYNYSSYFQVSLNQSNLNYLKTLLLYGMIKSSCETNLMPVDKEDQFWNIHCIIFQTYSVQGLVIMVQSRKDPRYIDKKVEAFLQNVPNMLRRLKSEDFETFKDYVEQFVKPSSLLDYSNKYWNGISNRYYRFEKTETEVKRIRSLTKFDLRNFSKAILDPSSSRRRKLSVHVFPKDTEQNRSGLTKYIPSGVRVPSDDCCFRK